MRKTIRRIKGWKEKTMLKTRIKQAVKKMKERWWINLTLHVVGSLVDLKCRLGLT